jgi:hypothetical protein
MNEIDEIREKMIKEVGEKTVKDFPFISSAQFLGLMKAVSAIPKVILVGSSGPAEAMNGIASMVISFLRNIPDKVWEELRKRAIPGGKGEEMFQLLDKVRSYQAGKAVEWHVEDDIPAFNVKPPTRPS